MNDSFFLCNLLSLNVGLTPSETYNTNAHWSDACRGRNRLCCCCLLFNDGNVLQICSDTVAIRRRMIYDGHVITDDEYGSNFLRFVLRLRKNPGKNLNEEIDPTGDRTRAHRVRSNDITPRPQRWLKQTELKH